MDSLSEEQRAHVNKLKQMNRERRITLPLCCVEGCWGRVMWGMRYGRYWQSKYCKKHGTQKKKLAIMLAKKAKAAKAACLSKNPTSSSHGVQPC